jgi:hypothetical protein
MPTRVLPNREITSNVSCHPPIKRRDAGSSVRLIKTETPGHCGQQTARLWALATRLRVKKAEGVVQKKPDSGRKPNSKKEQQTEEGEKAWAEHLAAGEAADVQRAKLKALRSRVLQEFVGSLGPDAIKRFFFCAPGARLRISYACRQKCAWLPLE